MHLNWIGALASKPLIEISSPEDNIRSVGMYDFVFLIRGVGAMFLLSLFVFFTNAIRAMPFVVVLYIPLKTHRIKNR
jgi:hypothetical protein